MKNRIVLKFGGSSVGTPEQIRHIAKKVAELHRAGKSIVIVVSAMGKTTDSLMALAHQVSPHPNRRELDMLVSTGERVSMALMSMALHDTSTPSISFTGSQAGIFTDNDFSNAKIIDLKPHRVEQALKENKVVVLAGFQGVHPETKEITTLGRGGSDTTAVAIAAHLKADRCEILKDVDGVFSADPKLVPTATLFKTIPIEILSDFCFWGAKVLHYRSVELAQRLDVPLFVGRSDNFQTGTSVLAKRGLMQNSSSAPQANAYESAEVAGINSHKEVHHLHIAATDSSEAFQNLAQVLQETKLPWPQILASAYDNGTCRLMYTADIDTLNGIKNAVSHHSKMKIGKSLSSVSVTCLGGVGNNLPHRLLKMLQDVGVSAEKTLLSNMTISFFVEQQNREKAIQTLSSILTTPR